ncbi:MAG: response regulator transcription factor [Myxococcales bacterium]|nr:response regulator transcription factor [Myxococcales bacterium]
MTTATIRPKIVVIDDDAAIGRLLTFGLGEAGFEAFWAATGAEGIALVLREQPAVAIVDMMLPDIFGTKVCERLRSDPAVGDVAILILSALGEEDDRVVGFEAGADDYVVKPFSPREFALRVKALVRRTEQVAPARAARLAWGGLVLDDVRHAVLLNGSEIVLRPLEYRLLAAFLEHPAQMFSRAALLELVWGMTTGIGDRTVDVHVRRLRSRLGGYAELIETVPGYGYRLKAPPR